MTTDPTQAWRTLAACAGLGPALFYSGHPSDIATARRVCATCPVADACAAAAQCNREPFGVWGGERQDDRAAAPLTTAALTDDRLIELFTVANPRCRAIDVLHRVDVSTASAYRYLARAIQLRLVERRGRHLYPIPRR